MYQYITAVFIWESTKAAQISANNPVVYSMIDLNCSALCISLPTIVFFFFSPQSRADLSATDSIRCCCHWRNIPKAEMFLVQSWAGLKKRLWCATASCFVAEAVVGELGGVVALMTG